MLSFCRRKGENWSLRFKKNVPVCSQIALNSHPAQLNYFCSYANLPVIVEAPLTVIQMSI